jgi:hypothetical protein
VGGGVATLKSLSTLSFFVRRSLNLDHQSSAIIYLDNLFNTYVRGVANDPVVTCRSILI